jgi:hypothetical protein
MHEFPLSSLVHYASFPDCVVAFWSESNCRCDEDPKTVFTFHGNSISKSSAVLA